VVNPELVPRAGALVPPWSVASDRSFTGRKGAGTVSWLEVLAVTEIIGFVDRNVPGRY
jgi:hypothetical protein